MPVGPINGSAAYEKLGVPPSNPASIIVPTAVQAGKDIAKLLSGITCLYDRYWYPRADVVTLPICMFYVTGYREIRDNDISEQRVMLYEPQVGDGVNPNVAFDPLRQSVMEAVADNVFVKPKSYELEIILPFQQISEQLMRTANETAQLVNALVSVMSGGNLPYQQAIDGIVGSPGLSVPQAFALAVDIGAKMPDSDMAAYANRNTLDIMAGTGRLLTMKLWTGYEYKYVVIKGCAISKKGNEDNVFRATLQLKEYPVLTVTPLKNARPLTINRNWAATAVSVTSRALMEPIIYATGVKKASGEE